MSIVGITATSTTTLTTGTVQQMPVNARRHQQRGPGERQGQFLLQILGTFNTVGTGILTCNAVGVWHASESQLLSWSHSVGCCRRSESSISRSGKEEIV
jgi:hypothetical protein